MRGVAPDPRPQFCVCDDTPCSCGAVQSGVAPDPPKRDWVEPIQKRGGYQPSGPTNPSPPPKPGVAPDPLDRIAAWATVVQYIDGQALRTPEGRRRALDAVQSLKKESETLVEVARAARSWATAERSDDIATNARTLRVALARLDKDTA